jgi:hypothetical protein
MGAVDCISPARVTVKVPNRRRFTCMLDTADYAKPHVPRAARALLDRRPYPRQRHGRVDGHFVLLGRLQGPQLGGSILVAPIRFGGRFRSPRQETRDQ